VAYEDSNNNNITLLCVFLLNPSFSLIRSHWSLIIVCMPAKESNSGPIILHLDSLGMHPSAQLFDTVGK
jgi:hypothetical protein